MSGQDKDGSDLR
jgi:hypothetical protein